MEHESVIDLLKRRKDKLIAESRFVKNWIEGCKKDLEDSYLALKNQEKELKEIEQVLIQLGVTNE